MPKQHELRYKARHDRLCWVSPPLTEHRLARQWIGCQLGKVARLPPALAQRFAPEPSDHPDHIHGCCRQELLEVRARQPQIPTPAEIKAPDPLRQAALHPARSAYWALNCGVSWRCRAARSASWWACGLTVSWRGAAWAEVHSRRVGHARQVAPSNRMRMTGSPETLCPGRQSTLEWPWGQRACLASQSMTKACRS